MQTLIPIQQFLSGVHALRARALHACALRARALPACALPQPDITFCTINIAQIKCQVDLLTFFVCRQQNT